MGWSAIRAIPIVRPIPFQSLRGFGVGWSLITTEMIIGILRFQSLRGFGVGWSQASKKNQKDEIGFNP